jgi:hypothetical protein
MTQGEILPRKKKTVSDAHLNQISVLKALAPDKHISTETTLGQSPKQFQIEEIVERSGLKDEKEVQRYLYILEGQKLVAPYPAGDFTSRSWHITREGQRAVKVISKAMTH